MATATLTVWLIAIPVLFSLACLVIALQVHRSAKAWVQHTDQQIEKLQKQIAVTTKGSIGMGQRLLTLESKLRALQAKQDELGEGDSFAYSQAMQMFKQGADIATVASSCGFSNSEAELMALVQKQLQNTRSTHDSDA
jgi:uncharacterized protein YoxC